MNFPPIGGPNNFAVALRACLAAFKPLGFHQTYNAIDTGEPYTFTDVHTAWSVMEIFCLQLPRPLVPDVMYHRYIRLYVPPHDLHNFIHGSMDQMEWEYRNVLRYVMEFLNEIVNRSSIKPEDIAEAVFLSLTHRLNPYLSPNYEYFRTLIVYMIYHFEHRDKLAGTRGAIANSHYSAPTFAPPPYGTNYNGYW